MEIIISREGKVVVVMRKRKNNALFNVLMHREPTQSVCVAYCYLRVNVLDLPFASPIAIYR